MKIKTLIIPVLSLSLVGVGVLVFKQDGVASNSSAQNIAEVTGSQVSNQKIFKVASVGGQATINTTKQVQSLPAEVHVEHIQTELNAFDNLSAGKKLAIYIPQEQQDFEGMVEKNHDQFGGQVQVASGSIDNGQQFSSFTVTKGPELTLVMVATGEKIYQIEIDNKTGAGTVIDDQSLDYFRKHDDGEATPPEGIS